MKAIVLSLLLSVLSLSQAATLELTQGRDSRNPIAVLKFAGAASISQVVQADLDRVGQFIVNYQTSGHLPHTAGAVIPGVWRNDGVNDVIVGQAKPLKNGRYRITFSLIDLFNRNHVDSNPVLSSKAYTVSKSQFRQVAHLISDEIYYQLTGKAGAFSTKIAYVLAVKQGQQRRYKLNIADYDGFKPQTVVSSPEPLMSPRWSPDGKQLAYVSFGRHGSEIYLLNVITGRRTLLLHFPGLNAAPAWSPDGKQLAVTLSRNGTQDIYVLTLANKHLAQLTHDSAIDTEPCFAPDGKSVFFVSNRQKTPAIYRLTFSSGVVSRVTYNGDYNVTPTVMPDGKHLVMIHKNDQGYTIAKQNLEDSVMLVLTPAGLLQSPSVSPNGSMILYANQSGQGRLAIVSSNGKSHWQLPALNGNMQEPSWSP